MGAGGQMMQGMAAEKKGKYVAKQLTRNAKAVEAAGQRAARQERAKADELESTAIARMSAGGGGIDTERLADIEQQGEYNALAALYESSTQADTLKEEAKLRRQEGKQKLRETRMGVASSLVSAGGSMMGSMGGGS